MAGMLRICLSQAAPRISASPNCRIAACLHTSAPLHAQPSRRQGGASIKKIHNLKKEERWRKEAQNRPSVVLGTRPGGEAKWKNCDLAKILVDEEALASTTELKPQRFEYGTVQLPQQMAFGIGKAEKQLLLGELPEYSSVSKSFRGAALLDAEQMALSHAVNETRELEKATQFAKLVDLRNANAQGIAYENRRRIVLAFSGPENAFDTGRSEVQAALLTYKIRNLWNHLSKFRRDVGNRRGLRKLVHQRAKILRYLKRTDRDRYETVLDRLALEPESVEGELVL